MVVKMQIGSCHSLLNTSSVPPFSDRYINHDMTCRLLHGDPCLLSRFVVLSLLFFRFISGCAGSSSLAGFLKWQGVGATLSLPCAGFSLQWFLSCWGAHALGLMGFSNCGGQA